MSNFTNCLFLPCTLWKSTIKNFLNILVPNLFIVYRCIVRTKKRRGALQSADVPQYKAFVAWEWQCLWPRVVMIERHNGRLHKIPLSFCRVFNTVTEKLTSFVNYVIESHCWKIDNVVERRCYFAPRFSQPCYDHKYTNQPINKNS